MVHGHDLIGQPKKSFLCDSLTLSQGCEKILFRPGYSNLFPTFNTFYFFHTFQSPKIQLKRLGYVHCTYNNGNINLLTRSSLEVSIVETNNVSSGEEVDGASHLVHLGSRLPVLSIFFIVQRRGARERRFELVKCKS
jgi:hypothetical protein